MPAKRLLVSLDENVFTRIQQIASTSHSSLSQIAKNLIVSSLELEEDQALSKLADLRMQNTRSWVKAEDAWG